MYEKDRPHPGKEMGTRTGFEILGNIIDGLKYDIQQNRNKEIKKEYHMIEGIRFQQEVPSETVHNFLEFLKQEENKFSEFAKNRNRAADTNSLVEHVIYGEIWRGTVKGRDITLPIARKPFVPYDLLSEYYSAVEVADSSRLDEKYKSRKVAYGPQRLDIEPVDLSVLNNFINENSQDIPEGSGSIGYIFEPMKFDKDTGTTSFPILRAMQFGYGHHSLEKELPEELRGKIKIKEVCDSYLSNKFDVDVVIDKEGWRIDL